MDNCLATINLLKNDLTTQNLEIQTLRADETALKDQLDQASCRINKYEQYSCIDILVVSGLSRSAADIAAGVPESFDRS